MNFVVSYFFRPKPAPTHERSLCEMSDDTLVLSAPLSGVVYPLERVPDPVFAQKLVGDGLSIDPTDATLRAPCAGEVMHVHPASHALTVARGRRRGGDDAHRHRHGEPERRGLYCAR